MCYIINLLNLMEKNLIHWSFIYLILMLLSLDFWIYRFVFLSINSNIVIASFMSSFDRCKRKYEIFFVLKKIYWRKILNWWKSRTENWRMIWQNWRLNPVWPLKISKLKSNNWRWVKLSKYIGLNSNTAIETGISAAPSALDRD